MPRFSPLFSQFHGPAQAVTGLRYLVVAGQLPIQVDRGFFQGLKQVHRRNFE